MKLFTKSNEPTAPLGILERLCYGCGNFGSGLMSQVITAFLLFFYTDYIHLNAGVVGIIFMIVRISDGFTDLIMGRIVDKTHSKYGRARVWILRMCIPYAIASVLLFTVPTGMTQLIQYIYVFIFYLLVSAIITTTLAVPYSSMAALITENPYERGILGVFSMFAGTFAGLVVSALTLKLVGFFGDGIMGWVLCTAFYGVFAILFELICFFGTRERSGVDASMVQEEETDKKAEKKKKAGDTSLKDSILTLLKNKYWVMFIIIGFGVWLITGLRSTAMIYYCNSVIGNADSYSILAMVSNVFMLVFLMLSFIFMKTIGKENTFRLGMICAMVGCIIMMILPTQLTALVVGTCILAIGSGLAAACLTGILADTLDYGEWKFGVSVVGMGMAVYSACMKLGSGIASVLWGFLLNIGHYDGSLDVQPSSAIFMIKTGYYYIPFVIALIAFILMLQFHLDKQNDKIHKELAERRAQAAESQDDQK